MSDHASASQGSTAATCLTPRGAAWRRSWGRPARHLLARGSPFALMLRTALPHALWGGPGELPTRKHINVAHNSQTDSRLVPGSSPGGPTNFPQKSCRCGGGDQPIRGNGRPIGGWVWRYTRRWESGGASCPAPRQRTLSAIQLVALGHHKPLASLVRHPVLWITLKATIRSS
jgi:hypothetical protein